MKEKDQDRSIFKEILGWLVYIAILLAAVYVLITYVGQRTEVSGHSMEPTLQHGDNLIVDKISYRFREPERYEIIVFPYIKQAMIKKQVHISNGSSDCREKLSRL